MSEQSSRMTYRCQIVYPSSLSVPTTWSLVRRLQFRLFSPLQPAAADTASLRSCRGRSAFYQACLMFVRFSTQLAVGLGRRWMMGAKCQFKLVSCDVCVSSISISPKGCYMLYVCCGVVLSARCPTRVTQPNIKQAPNTERANQTPRRGRGLVGSAIKVDRSGSKSLARARLAIRRNGVLFSVARMDNVGKSLLHPPSSTELMLF